MHRLAANIAQQTQTYNMLVEIVKAVRNARHEARKQGKP